MNTYLKTVLSITKTTIVILPSCIRFVAHPTCIACTSLKHVFHSFFATELRLMVFAQTLTTQPMLQDVTVITLTLIISTDALPVQSPHECIDILDFFLLLFDLGVS